MYTIYALVDPRTSEIRYIGQTQNHPSVRLQGHLKKDDGNKRKWEWLMELRLLGMIPVAVVLDYADTLQNSLAREQYWIRKGKESGWPLLNFRVDGRQRRRLLIPNRAENATQKLTMTTPEWYEWTLASYLPTHPELLQVDAQGRGVGVTALARAMAELARGDVAQVDAFKGVASEVAKRLRNELRLPGGERLGMDISHTEAPQ